MANEYIQKELASFASRVEQLDRDFAPVRERIEEALKHNPKSVTLEQAKAQVKK